MNPAIQLINFNYNNTEERAVIHGTIVKYNSNKYCHCFRGTDDIDNWTPKIDKQLNGGKE